ncbi:MAG: lipopolysaccharide biosynthesis protein [Candidatus Omnitrophica bacterium]|nr:lipopolysaccharide biosynthesis protein [Candidatus Omnitrophota bacterium]
MTSLKHKTASGVKWQVVLQVVQKIISVITFAVLARILEPSVFGLFALAFVAIDGLSLFKTFGIDAKVIQQKTITDLDKNTAFWMVQATGVIVFVLCLSSAPFAGRFFNNGDVTSVIQALGIIFVVNGFGKVPSALLTREMRFRLISVIQLIAGIVNSVCAVVFALMWPTVWSLVLAYLIKTILTDVLSWYFSKFRLRFEFDKTAAKEFIRFGSSLMGGGFIRYITDNLSNITVGKMLGTTLVGYLALANNIASFINTHFTLLMLRVLLPTYSVLQDDKEELKRVFFKILKFVSALTVPFCIALIILARDLVLILYGEKWLVIVPIVQIAACSQLVGSIMCNIGPVYMACGRPKYVFHIAVAGLVIRIPMVIVFTHLWGLKGTVAADLTTDLILAPIGLALVRKSIQFTYKQFLEPFLYPLVSTIVMVGAILLVRNHFGFLSFANGFLQHNFYILLQILVLTLVGCIAYGVAFFLFDRSFTLEIKQLIFKPSEVRGS